MANTLAQAALLFFLLIGMALAFQRGVWANTFAFGPLFIGIFALPLLPGLTGISTHDTSHLIRLAFGFLGLVALIKIVRYLWITRSRVP